MHIPFSSAYNCPAAFQSDLHYSDTTYCDFTVLKNTQ